MLKKVTRDRKDVSELFVTSITDYKYYRDKYFKKFQYFILNLRIL